MNNKNSRDFLDKLISRITGSYVAQDSAATKGLDLARSIIMATVELGSVEFWLVDTEHIRVSVDDLVVTQYVDHAGGRIRQILTQMAYGIDEFRFPGSHELPLLDTITIEKAIVYDQSSTDRNKQLATPEIAKIRAQTRLINDHKNKLAQQGVEWVNVYGFDITIDYIDSLMNHNQVNVVTSNKNGFPFFLASKRMDKVGEIHETY